MDKRKSHWETIYETKTTDSVSWYAEHLESSLRLILDTGIRKEEAIIDIGGGSSTLVDDLLALGFKDISVLDISDKALSNSRARLGDRASKINWIEADITSVNLPEDNYVVWHDRAVFHFLTDAEDRHRYIELAKRSIKVGGHVIVASFALDGPEKCSGLNVVRYSPETMHDEFGGSFELVDHHDELHHTPFGTTQKFVYCYCRRV